MHYLTPTWPAPSCIKAYTSLRMEGHSQPPYDSFNLSTVVADDADAVAKNRAQLAAELKLTHAPVWIKQVHGIEVVPAHNLPIPISPEGAVFASEGEITKPGGFLRGDSLFPPNSISRHPPDDLSVGTARLSNTSRDFLRGHDLTESSILKGERYMPEADASWTDVPQLPCAVLTADCLPLLLCAPDGTRVAAIHAGWRGLAAGVIEATLDALDTNPDWLVWLGPAIGPTAFEVGGEVRALFLEADPQAASAFQSLRSEKYLVDIYALAKQRLARYGIHRIYGGEYCTYSDAARFYSYRRDKEKAGRMVSLIWIDNP